MFYIMKKNKGINKYRIAGTSLNAKKIFFEVNSYNFLKAVSFYFWEG